LIETKQKQSGGKCFVCGFDFKEHYKGIWRDHLVAHHAVQARPLFKEQHVEPIGQPKRASKSTLDEIELLCPNCHSAVHSQDPPLSADELRGRLIL
jgi:5-methylcytosine-specific restriction protein A